MKKITLTAFNLIALTMVGAFAQTSFSTGSYSQNFDSLPNTGTAATWTNNTTLAGWSAIAPLLTPTTITPQTGSGSTGLLGSFGANANSDRSLGWVFANGIGAAATQASIGFGLTNSTVFTIDNFTLGYLGRQWRTNNSTPGNLAVQYKIGGSFDNSTSGWTSINALTFTGPNTTGAASIDGYSAGNTASSSTTVSSISWAPASVLWIRWVDTNDVGTDAQLAIDNVSFTAVPEPRQYALAFSGMLIALVVARRRRAGHMS